MTLVQVVLLGIVQGLTEFLPISSSAHLVLTPYFLGWRFPPQEIFIFDVLVQVASLVAVIAYFKDELWGIGRAWLMGLASRRPFADPLARQGWWLLLATLPAGLAGLLLKDQVEMAFSSPLASALFLLVTGGLLWFGEHIGRKERSLEGMRWQDALGMGCAQALAIFPGISRSGATITGGLACHLTRPAATRFAFLMSLPIMLAAGGSAVADLVRFPAWKTLLPLFLPGFLASAAVSYLSIHWLLRFVAQRSLRPFALYCFGVATLTLLSLWLQG